MLEVYVASSRAEMPRWNENRQALADAWTSMLNKVQQSITAALRTPARIAVSPSMEGLLQEVRANYSGDQRQLLPVYFSGKRWVIGPWSSAEQPWCLNCASVSEEFEVLADDGDWIPATLSSKEAPTTLPVPNLLMPYLVLLFESLRWSKTSLIVEWDPTKGLPQLHRLDLPFRCFLHSDWDADAPREYPTLFQDAMLVSQESFRAIDQAGDIRIRQAVPLTSSPFGFSSAPSRETKIVDYSLVRLNYSGFPVVGVGRGGNTEQEDSMVAFLEMHERAAGLFPQAKRTTVRNTPYSQLQTRGLNPESLILHSTQQYELPQFPFQPFQPDLPLNWVWGYSLTRGAPVLLPESIAYYGTSILGRSLDEVPMAERKLAYDVSNGCAVGGSLEEAIAFGLFEVLERDAVLTAWYSEDPGLRIDSSQISEPKVIEMWQFIENAGFSLEARLVGGLRGISCIWLIATNIYGDFPKIVSASGAHPNLQKAIKGSVAELAACVSFLTSLSNDQIIDYQNRNMSVSTSEEHGIYAGLRGLPLWATESRPNSEPQELTETRSHALVDLSHYIKDIVGELEEREQEVVFVHQTTPRQASLGLETVRVFVTGALPMTFGKDFYRLSSQQLVDGMRKPKNPPIPHPFM